MGNERGIRGRLPAAIANRLPGGKREQPRAPWLSDAPPDLTATKDAFGVDEIIDGLVHLLADARPPFTLSLSGSWGIGKSTVAEAVVKRLQDRGEAAVLVDAWTEDIPTLRRSLVVAVAAALQARGRSGQEASAREDIARDLDEKTRQSKTSTQAPETEFSFIRTAREALRHPLALLVLLASIAALLVSLFLVDPNAPMGRALPPILGILVGFLVVNSGYIFFVRASTVTTGPAERSVLEHQQFRAHVTGGKDSPDRVLVVVDNLDRLPGEDAVKALSEIRALVEIKGSRCVFMIPVDRDALVGHIKGALEGSGDGPSDKEAAAKQYLDKFFNLDLLLTQPEPIDIREWALEQATQILPSDDVDDLRSAVQIVAYAAGNSPRAVKRILNGISSRHRLLHPEGRPSLTKLALVESLLAQFPTLLRGMSEEPRNFVNARARLGSASGADAQAAALAEVVGNAKVDLPLLNSFLAAYRDVELSVPELRLVLSLRPDREWSGVTDPTELRAAVWEGDGEAFATALRGTPENEQAVALSRAIYRVERSINFPRDALNALVATVTVIADYPTETHRLRTAAVRTLLASDLPRRLVTADLASFVFGGEHWQIGDLATAFVATLESAQDTAQPGLVRAVQLAVTRLDKADGDKARAALAVLPPATLESLFEPNVDVGLVTGPVAAAFAGRAAALDLTADDQSATIMNLDRLAQFRNAGGKADASFAPIAARLVEQIGLVTGDLTAPALDVLAHSVNAIQGIDDPALDLLAAALETRPGPNRAPYFDAVLRLGVAAARQASTIAALDQWLSTADLRPAYVQQLLADHATMLDAGPSAWRDRLCEQWVGQKEPEFASLVVVHGGSEGLARVIAAGVGAPVPEMPARVTEAVAILAADPSALQAIADAVAGWAKGANPLPALGSVGPVLADLERRGADVSKFAAALADRAASVSAATEVATLVGAAAQIHAAGCLSVAAASDGLARRAVAVGVVDVRAAEWIAMNTSERSLGAKLLAEAIESSTVPVGAAISAADRARSPLGRTADIAFALVSRAAASATTEAEAESLLDQARMWRPQPAATKTDYEALLSSIAGRWPDLDHLVDELKVLGKRKRK